MFWCFIIKSIVFFNLPNTASTLYEQSLSVWACSRSEASFLEHSGFNARACSLVLFRAFISRWNQETLILTSWLLSVLSFLLFASFVCVCVRARVYLPWVHFLGGREILSFAEGLKLLSFFVTEFLYKEICSLFRCGGRMWHLAIPFLFLLFFFSLMLIVD